MLNPSADRDVNNSYQLSTEKARNWWNMQGFESRKNVVIESDAVINDDELVVDQTVSDIADKDYDDLPDITKQEVDLKIDEEDVEELFEVQDEEYLKCSICDDVFTTNEDYELHRSVDHGEEPEDFEESEETYQLTMHPELTRESLRKANDLLTETEEKQLYSGYDKTGGVQSSVMPYNVPSVATGKYDDNPNKFFYSNKIFRAGSSTERTSSLGEAKASEDFGNAQQKWNSLGWMGRSNVLKKVGLDNISPDTNVWGLNSDDWDTISAELIDYDTESKASEIGGVTFPLQDNFNIEYLQEDNYEAECMQCGKFIQYTGDGSGSQILRSHLVDEHNFSVESTDRFEADIENDQVVQKLPDDKRSFDVEATEKGEWDWLDKGADSKSVDYDEVEYKDDGVSDISIQKTEPKLKDQNAFLDNVNIGLESVDFVYKTKSNESNDKSYITESESFDEEYEEFEDSDEAMIKETITLRKLTGYGDDSIARELHINYNISHEEALEKVYSVEVSTNDKVSQTFFGKMYRECTESEKDELRMYSGSD